MKSFLGKPQFTGFISFFVTLLCVIITNSCSSISSPNLPPPFQATLFASSVYTPSFTLPSTLFHASIFMPTSTPKQEGGIWETNGPWGGRVEFVAIDPNNSCFSHSDSIDKI